VVTRALQKDLESRPEAAKLKGSHGHVQVFYCCGTDHAAKCGLYFGMGADRGIGLVVVPRTGETPEAERPNKLVFVAEPASGEVAGFSSTKLRKALERQDIREVAAATSETAAQLLLQPTAEDIAIFQAAYEKMPTAGAK